MTNCSFLPRDLGTLPAGSAVREKSRLALYSARGAADDARVREGLAVLVEVSDLRLDVAVRPAAPLDALRSEPFGLFARAAVFRTAVRFVPDRVPDRVLAMPRDFAKSMPAGTV